MENRPTSLIPLVIEPAPSSEGLLRAMSKVVVVTGGSRGIGAATCRLAAGRGYAVCVNYRENRDAAEAVVRDCRHRGVMLIDHADQAGAPCSTSTVTCVLPA